MVDLLELVRVVGEAALCNNKGCVVVKESCEEHKFDSLDGIYCVKPKAELVKLGYAEDGLVEELLEKMEQVYAARKYAEEKAEKFRNGEASLAEAIAIWAKYLKLKADLDRNTNKAKQLIEKALYGKSDNEQYKTIEERLYDAIKAVIYKEAITSCEQCL